MKLLHTAALRNAVKDENTQTNAGKVGSITLQLLHTFIGGPSTIFLLGFQAEGSLIVSAAKVSEKVFSKWP